MGCSHFIIGRDHTGIGDFYPPDANQRMFEEIGEIGIGIVRFGAIGYDPKAGGYTEAHDGLKLQSISGTQARDSLRANEPLPDWFMDDIVQDMLRREITAGRPVFVE